MKCKKLVIEKLDAYINSRLSKSNHCGGFFGKVGLMCRDSKLTDDKVTDARDLKEKILTYTDTTSVFKLLAERAIANQNMENKKSIGKEFISCFTESMYATTLESCLMQVIPILQQKNIPEINDLLVKTLNNFWEFPKKTTDFEDFCRAFSSVLEKSLSFKKSC